MQIKKDAELLRIFIGDAKKISSVPVYEKIVTEAKKFGLAGATVLKGVMGYGGSSRIHTTKILRLSEDLPIIIEIVDEMEKIESFLPIVDDLFERANCTGLVTLEKAHIIRYTANNK